MSLISFHPRNERTAEDFAPWSRFFRLDSIDPCNAYVYPQDIIDVAEGRCPRCCTDMVDVTTAMDSIFGTVWKCCACVQMFTLDGGRIMTSHPTAWKIDSTGHPVASGAAKPVLSVYIDGEEVAEFGKND